MIMTSISINNLFKVVCFMILFVCCIVINVYGEDDSLIEHYSYFTQNCSISSSSNKNDVYNENMLLDDNPETAWISNEDNANNQWLLFECRQVNQYNSNYICITNGFNENETMYNDYSRVKKMQIYINNKYVKTVDLLDSSMTNCFFNINNSNNASKVQLNITDLYQGDKYHAVAISELWIGGITGYGKFNLHEFAKIEYPRFVVMDISGIVINNSTTALEFLSNNNVNDTCLFESICNCCLFLFNKDESQLITLSSNPGSAIHSYDKISVYANIDPDSYMSIIDRFYLSLAFGNKRNTWKKYISLVADLHDKVQRTNVDVFSSRNGIALNMTIKQVIEILGIPNANTIMNQITTLFYSIRKGDENSSFLEYYNMPRYEGKYIFYRNRLIYFETGFPNP